jgi:flagellar motor switch protein FliM
MSVRSEEPIEPETAGESTSGEQKAAGKPRSIVPCNFRSAGRLSNESARSLTAIHETFARNLTEALAAYVGAEMKVSLLTLDQIAVKNHIAAIPPFSYIAAFPIAAVSSVMILECDAELVFPIIDLLLGGTGVLAAESRAFSEIEEEIMQDVMLLIARQAIAAWGIPEATVAPSASIQPEALPEICPASERLTLVKFEIEVAGATGALQVAFPASFAGILIKRSQVGQPKKKGALRFFPKASVRERILDCDVLVAADLLGMRVPVRDLIALQPGYVLKLRAPVRTPGMLTVAGLEIFEAVPVRNGAQKAAQVGRRVTPASWGKE